MFDANFKPEPVERQSMRIALKRNANAGGKNPVLKGYVILRLAQAEQLVEQCKAAEDGVVFLDVALWDGQDPEAKHPLAGNVSTRSFNRDKAEAEAAALNDKPSPSIWY